MIGRATARAIAELITVSFTEYHGGSYGRGYYGSDASALYDFLYDESFPAWLCNAARASCNNLTTRPLQDFLMKLHTGEAQVPVTKDWQWPERERLGQEYLQQLADAILRHWAGELVVHAGTAVRESLAACQRKLELDGYIWRDGKLSMGEESIVDVEEEMGTLERLYKELSLGRRDVALHHLQLSEQQYVAGNWDDAIGNARKFLECVLSESAVAYAARTDHGLTGDQASRPQAVRDYLERAGLIETKEKLALASLYGLLSETGAHPYMARNDQARLLRHLALTIGQFVMLRLKGSEG